VLQRESPVPVWGTATPGEKVEVKFRGQTKSAVADQQGQWRLKLDPLQAGGPDVLTIGEHKIDDVLVGEVWIGSGQSNMAMPSTSYTGGDAVLARNVAQSYPKLRLLKQNSGDKWQEATPENIASFSALLFSFGLPLQQALDVPVGLMLGAVGGTPSGFWLSEEMYRRDPACAEAVKKFAPTYPYEQLLEKNKEAQAKYETELAAWKLVVEAAKKEGKPAPRGPRAPAGVGKPGETNTGRIGQLFEAFIRPYVGYAIRGVLWDQGESRTNIVGVDQYTLMGALIKGWRNEWGQGEFPFLYVHKPSGGGPAWDYTNPVTANADKFAAQPTALPPPPNPEYSPAQFLKIARYPNTYMATSIDLGGGTHPVNKSGYGARGAHVALGAVYGHKHEIYGPLYAAHQIDGGKVAIKFTHTGKGLAFKNGDKLQGFLIAADRDTFTWADAQIVGDTVVVSSPGVPKPVAVRYAWSNSFRWANLFNQDGLPAQPFRTDEW
jgi:sialate O-acetylesterase